MHGGLRQGCWLSCKWIRAALLRKSDWVAVETGRRRVYSDEHEPVSAHDAFDRDGCVPASHACPAQRRYGKKIRNAGIRLVSVRSMPDGE